MPHDRMRRINQLLRDELAAEIHRSLDLPPGVFVSVTKVKTAPDLHNATVYVSILPDNQTGSVLRILQNHIKELSTQIAPRLTLRFFPRLYIKLDETERQATHIEHILDSLSDS